MSRKLRELTEEDIDKIADTYKAFVQQLTQQKLKNMITYWHLEDMLVLKNKRMMGNHLSKR